ncbi:hypothetical protein WMY93_011948 [Mugilogobius chulae]|uniref:C2H2-type domain-containing protein n=1 Tax=Mugilogobius chulae TaxID=88201 RepID=A0AAW0P7I1_9GOBI
MAEVRTDEMSETPRIQEKPNEQLSVPESSDQQSQSESEEDTQGVDMSAEPEEDTEHSPAQNPAPDTSTSVNNKDPPGTAEERKHPCTVCGKRFTNKSNLRHHMRTHSTDKRYICQFCNKGFTLIDSLRYHRKSDLSEVFQLFGL